MIIGRKFLSSLGRVSASMKSFQLYNQTPKEKELEKKKIRGFLKKIGLYPHYTEVSLFLVLVSFFLLFFTNLDLSELSWFLLDPGVIFVIIFLLMGGFYATYYTFRLDKSVSSLTARSSMAGFGILTQVFSTMFLVLTSSAGSEIVFWIGLLNLIYAFLLIMAASEGYIGYEVVNTKNAKISEIVLGLILVVSIFLISQYYYNHDPALTFSLMTSYAVIINEMFSQIFVKR